MSIDDSFYLYGRPDAKKPGRGIDIRKTPKEIMEKLDSRKPVIVLDHEPSELKELSEAGVDIDLCGHTHDGQMFPGNLVTKLFSVGEFLRLSEEGGDAQYCDVRDIRIRSDRI